MRTAVRKAVGRRHGSHGKKGNLYERGRTTVLECGRLLEQGSGGLFEKEAEILIERINILIQREQTEMRERIKVSMYLCATAGIFLVLILV